MSKASEVSDRVEAPTESEITSTSELEDAWSAALADAEERARVSGRKDIAEYLALRRSNDSLRRLGSEWLLQTFIGLAAEANRLGAGLQSSQEEGHKFRVGHATMVGSLLTLQKGVRALSVEVGWPRTPGDGIVRGNGLACGNINHLGIKSKSKSLLLVRSLDGAPRWFVSDEHGRGSELHVANAREHLSLLLDAK
jgi:hypothetical protein